MPRSRRRKVKMTTKDAIWRYIFELFYVRSYDELMEKLRAEYKIAL